MCVSNLRSYNIGPGATGRQQLWVFPPSKRSLSPLGKQSLSLAFFGTYVVHLPDFFYYPVRLVTRGMISVPRLGSKAKGLGVSEFGGAALVFAAQERHLAIPFRMSAALRT